MMRIQRPEPIPVISFLIIQIFWMTLYIQGIFYLLGGISAQIVLLFFWLLTILMRPMRSVNAIVNAIIGRLRAHRLELMLLTMFIIVTALNLLFDRGIKAYGYFIRSLLLLITYVTVIIHLKQNHARYAQASIAMTLAIGVAALYTLSFIVGELRVNPFSITHYNFQGRGADYADYVEWFAGWSFYTMCAIAMPCLIAAALRRRGALRYCSLALCLSTIVMLVLSTFAAAVILLLMGFTGFFLFSIRKPKPYLVIVLIALICFFLMRQFDVAQIVQIQHLGTKIFGIFDVSRPINYYDPSDSRGRLLLIKNSWQTFMQHPLFGIGTEDWMLSDDDIGNHSGIVDGLAQFGVLGLMWYVMFLAICFRRLFAALRRDPTDIIHQARFLTFILFLAGAMVNPMIFDVGISALVFILSLSPIGIGLNTAVAKGGAHA